MHLWVSLLPSALAGGGDIMAASRWSLPAVAVLPIASAPSLSSSSFPLDDAMTDGQDGSIRDVNFGSMDSGNVEKRVYCNET